MSLGSSDLNARPSADFWNGGGSMRSQVLECIKPRAGAKGYKKARRFPAGGSSAHQKAHRLFPAVGPWKTTSADCAILAETRLGASGVLTCLCFLVFVIQASLHVRGSPLGNDLHHAWLEFLDALVADKCRHFPPE